MKKPRLLTRQIQEFYEVGTCVDFVLGTAKVTLALNPNKFFVSPIDPF